MGKSSVSETSVVASSKQNKKKNSNATVKKGLGKRHKNVEERRGLARLRDGGIKRLLRKAGGIRAQKLIYERIRELIGYELRAVLKPAVAFQEFERKKTLQSKHVNFGFENRGIKLFGGATQ